MKVLQLLPQFGNVYRFAEQDTHALCKQSLGHSFLEGGAKPIGVHTFNRSAGWKLGRIIASRAEAMNGMHPGSGQIRQQTCTPPNNSHRKLVGACC